MRTICIGEGAKSRQYTWEKTYSVLFSLPLLKKISKHHNDDEKLPQRFTCRFVCKSITIPGVNHQMSAFGLYETL